MLLTYVCQDPDPSVHNVCYFSVIVSPGNKYWSGLLRDYYGPRAAIYFKYLQESLQKGTGFDLTSWRRDWVKLTNDWQKSRKLFPVKAIGNALNTSSWLYHKYLRDPETQTFDH